MLTDPDWEVPQSPTLAWLRANVARFSSGVDHARRRQYVLDALATVEPAQLSTAAHHRAMSIVDLGHDVVESARTVIVETLADALGLAVPADAVARMAPNYLSGESTAEADAAVATLVRACGGRADERTAALIGILAQSCEATAGLVRNAARVQGAADPVAAALRDDPPVLATRRASVITGEVVTVALDGFPFGAGPHACPGAAHAQALAAGVLAAR